MTEEQTAEADAPPVKKKAPPTEAEKTAWMLAPCGNRTDLDKLLERKSEALIELVGKPKIARFLAIVKTQSRRQPELLECTRESMMDAVILSALTGCMPGPLGHMYLIARYNKHNEDEHGNARREVSPMLGYKGMLKLVMSHPLVALAEAKVVYDGDEFHVDHGNHVIRHIEKAKVRNADTLIYVYSRVYLHGLLDLPMFLVYGLEQIAHARESSSAPNGSFWRKHFVPMARKCVIRAHCNGGEVPLTDVLEDAISHELEEEFKEADVIVHDVAGSGVDALKAKLGITDPPDSGTSPNDADEVQARDRPLTSEERDELDAGDDPTRGNSDGEAPPPKSDRDIIMDDIAQQTERLQINRATVLREASLLLGQECTDLSQLHIDTLHGLLGVLESKTEDDVLPF
jgi:recombination protein RecT